MAAARETLPMKVSMLHPQSFEHPEMDVLLRLESTPFEPDVITPVSSQGLMSPYEAATGAVLPIVSTAPGQRNGHHPHFFRRWFEHPDTPDDVLALRYSRKQSTSMAGHKKYHDWYQGTLCPADEKDILRLVNLTLAGYVPPFGVDCDSDIPQIIELNNQQQIQLRNPGIFRPERSYYKQSKIGQFLVKTAIKNSIDDETESLIDQFVSITERHMIESAERTVEKLVLTQKIIRKGITKAVSDIEKDYREARAREALRFGAPVCAFLVLDEFIGQHVFQYVDVLEDDLRQLVFGN